jgi:hypothetical protein
MTQYKALCSVLLGLLGLAVAGCSSSGPAPVTVSGTVTLDGKPLAGAILEFVAVDQKAKLGGDVTQTDAEGNFSIVPDKRKRGLLPGKFAVRVSKWVDKKTKAQAPLDDIDSLKRAGTVDNELDPRYSAPNTPLGVDLKPGVNEGVKLALESPKKDKKGKPK